MWFLKLLQPERCNMSCYHIWRQHVLNPISWNLHISVAQRVAFFFFKHSQGWGGNLSVKSDFCAFLIMERGSLDGETKSCLCLGSLDLALSPGESGVQCKVEQSSGDCMLHKGLSQGSSYGPLPMLHQKTVRTPHMCSSRTFSGNPKNTVK